ncbi:hypothetical protein FIM84_04915 [Helicobacter pylori]|nr:hypothetical protein FIM84_04915 [Helicobacter pylori]
MYAAHPIKPLKAPKLKTKFLRRVFVGASIRRWNDQACPLEFVELDKQAHKAMIAYLLAKDLKDRGNDLDLDLLKPPKQKSQISLVFGMNALVPLGTI